MKYIFKVVVFALIISLILPIKSRADDIDYNWFIIKNGSSPPSFSEQADMVSCESGYYIDKAAVNNNEKIIYLTFDVGYENGNIKKTLEILKEENVKGAFFILANLLIKDPDIVKQMFEDGHLVCNHTKNHKNMSTLTNDEMRDNLLSLEKLCKENTGYEMKKYFRFPEGKFCERTIKNANSLGYKTFFWSLAYADWDNSVKQSPDSAINKLIKNTHPGAIILLHPTSDINVEILPVLIEKWRNEGYSFGSLETLIERNE